MNCLLCNSIINDIPRWRDIITFNIRNSELCDFCLSRFQTIESRNICLRCMGNSNQSICGNCIMWEKTENILVNHKSIFKYNLQMKEYFRTYKFMGDLELSRLFDNELEKFKKQLDFDIVTFVPNARSHYDYRGFDHVFEMYNRVFKLESMLEKNDIEDFQSRKSFKERVSTVQSFTVKQNQISENSKILLIDDIYTSGRTITHAQKALNKAGYKKILTFSLVRS